MNIKNLISLMLFCIFIAAYLLKLYILYKRNRINANVLAKGNKEKKIKRAEILVKAATFVWGTVWFLYSWLEDVSKSYIGVFAESVLLDGAGLVIMSLGLITFIVAMTSMKSSWRVGIDKQTKSDLVTGGIYRYSRNPAFVGFDLMFLGLLITYPNFLTLAVAILNCASMHRLIRQEERHLQSVFGAEYLQYCLKTPRYILLKGSVEGNRKIS